MTRIFLPVFAQKEDISKKSFMRFLPKYYDGVVAFILDKKFITDEYKNIENIPERSILVINQNATDILYEVKRYVATKYF